MIICLYLAAIENWSSFDATNLKSFYEALLFVLSGNFSDFNKYKC